jgi:hypothetical protein
MGRRWLLLMRRGKWRWGMRGFCRLNGWRWRKRGREREGERVCVCVDTRDRCKRILQHVYFSFALWTFVYNPLAIDTASLLTYSFKEPTNNPLSITPKQATLPSLLRPGRKLLSNILRILPRQSNIPNTTPSAKTNPPT